MSKGKLAKFAEMEQFRNVFQYPFSVVSDVSFPMKGTWHRDYFHNENPIVLELGCGKGEYTVDLARRYPEKNFIGVDIKGARMWTGAKRALEEGLSNAAFLRTNIEIIDRFFAEDEVDEIWLTFSDPQMKNPRKRLSSSYFLERYRRFLKDGGLIHLKTDSQFLFTYTQALLEASALPAAVITDDLYGEEGTALTSDDVRQIQTYYEKMWISRGISIKYLCFELPRKAPLTEPDIEIPLDDYRSYRRDKRSGSETHK